MCNLLQFDHEKWFEIHLVFFSLATNIEYRDTIIRIMRIFQIIIFGMLIWREEIPWKGSSMKCQSIFHTKITLFYRHNKKETIILSTTKSIVNKNRTNKIDCINRK